MEEALQTLELELRKSISEEQEATAAYLERKQFLMNLGLAALEEDEEEIGAKYLLAAEMLDDILKEEKIHIGQLTQTLVEVGITLNKEEEGAEEGHEIALRFEQGDVDGI